MGIYFSFENYTKYHNYLVLSVISLLFFYFFYGINYMGGFKNLTFFKSQEKYAEQFMIHQIFCYFGTAIMSYLSYLKVDKKEEDNLSIEDYHKIASNKNTIVSIVYSHAKEQKISYSFFIFIIFCWVFLDQAIENKFIGFFPNMDFWMLELIILTFLNAKIFKISIYRHHLFAIFFNLLPILLKVMNLYNTFKGSKPPEEGQSKYSNEDGGLKPLYVVYWYFIFIGIIIYLCLITLRAYVYIQLKYFMDLKYVSPNKLLLIYGLTGGILYSSICTFTTFVKCDDSEELNIYDYICSVKNNTNNTNNTDNTNNIYYTNITNNTNNNDKYFANFIFYFTTSNDFRDILSEIFTVFLEIQGFYFYKFFMSLSIHYLTPVHVLFILPVSYFFRKIIIIATNIYMFDFNFISHADWGQFTLDTLGDIFSIIGFLIYLEILQISFCKLNYNVRNKIIERSKTEIYELLENY